MGCRRCERLTKRVAKLEEQLAAALAEIEQLQGKLAAAQKNSSTSSKPPSSDIVKPPKPPGVGKGKKRKRRAGGQPGHPRHVRPLFPADQVDHRWLYEWTEDDPLWEPLDELRTVQQVELPFQRIIPAIGGVDISPIVVLIVLQLVLVAPVTALERMAKAMVW